MTKRKENIFNGISIDIIGYLASIFLSFALLPWYFEYISKSEYGIWLVVNGLVSVISLIDVGVDQYLTKYIADDKLFYSEKISSFFFEALKVKFLIALLFLLIGLIFFFTINYFVRIDDQFQEVAKTSFLISLITLVLNLFLTTFSNIFFVRHYYFLVNFSNSIVLILPSLLTLYLLYWDFGIIAFPVAICIISIFQLIYFIVKFKLKFPHVTMSSNYFKLSIEKELYIFSKSFIILKWIHLIRTQYVIIVLNNLLGASYSTRYNITSRLPLLMQTLTSKFALMLFPSFSEINSSGQVEKLKGLFLSVNKLLFRISILGGVLLIAFNEKFISLWLGQYIYLGNLVLFLLLLHAIIYSSMGFFGIVVFSLQKFGKWTKWCLAEIMLLFIITFCFWERLNLISIISLFVFSSLINQSYLFYHVLKLLNVSFKEFANSVLSYSFKSNFSIFVFTALSLKYFNIDSWKSLIFTIVFLIVSNFLIVDGPKFMNSNSKSLFGRLLDSFDL